MKRSPTNVGASVRARLSTLAREKGINLELLLVRYAYERLLYRLGRSPYRRRFILKGAMLQTIWLADPFRPTRDLDLLGHGDSEPDFLRTVFREILAIPCDDGVVFDLDGLSVEPIREETEYGGRRIETTAHVSGARPKIRIDLGFGDTVTPEPNEVAYPVLLDQPAPKVRAYPKETVVAEKLQAIVVLGAANGRMKDFYDLWMMSRHFAFEAALLAEAIAATFARRRTPLPAGIPAGLSEAFGTDSAVVRRWQSFRTRNVLSEQPGSLANVVAALRDFLMPVIRLADGSDADATLWPPGGPWSR